MKVVRTLIVSAALLIGFPVGAYSAGSPVLDVRVHPALDLKIISTDTQTPRRMVAVGSDRVFVTEFDWTPGKGRLSRLDRASNGTWSRSTVFRSLDRPFGIAIGPDRQVYVGEAGRVFRFDPSSASPTRQDVIGGSASAKRIIMTKKARHPLTEVAFLQDKSLLVSLGSDTDNCETFKGKPACPAALGTNAVGVVRKYAMQWPQGTAGAWTLVARGLRNSMGLVQHSSGTVLQIENSRDDISKADPTLSDDLLPHDEINELDLAALRDYGWPHCYDSQVPSPEFRKFNCARTNAPVKLLPAHSAPLGFTYWTGAAPGGFAGKLVVSLHGYRETGHRLIAFDVDGRGRPKGDPITLVDDWDEKDLASGATQNIGGPVGVVAMSDGSLVVADDRNNVIFQLTAKG